MRLLYQYPINVKYAHSFGYGIKTVAGTITNTTSTYDACYSGWHDYIESPGTISTLGSEYKCIDKILVVGSILYTYNGITLLGISGNGYYLKLPAVASGQIMYRLIDGIIAEIFTIS